MKYINLGIVFFLLLIITAISLDSTLNSYYDFYFEKSNKTENPNIDFLLNGLIKNKSVNILTSYTGLETGYGFYAPNVASNFWIKSKIFDKDCKLIETYSNVPFKSKEGLVRFSSFQTIFLDKLMKDMDDNHIKYIDLLISQVQDYLLTINPNAHHIQSDLYLYNIIKLENFESNKSSSYQTLIESYSK